MFAAFSVVSEPFHFGVGVGVDIEIIEMVGVHRNR